MKTWEREQSASPSPVPLATFPRYPAAVARRLVDLAMSDPTPAEYERRKREILKEASSQ